MWIKRQTYTHLNDKIKNLENTIAAKDSEYNCLKERLENEIIRLSELISEKTTDCNVGIWCEDCVHCGRDSEIIYRCKDFSGIWIFEDAGKVIYCKKHIHDICPEFDFGVRK